MHRLRGPTITYLRETSVGDWARSTRLALHLTQQELAAMTGVPPRDIESFENNIPVSVESRRRLVKELCAAGNNHQI